MRNMSRGVSDVVGFVLIFGLIVATLSVVYVSGFEALTEERDDEELRNVERAYDVFADNLRDVTRGDAPSRDTEFSLGTSEMYIGDAIAIRIEVGGDEVEIGAYPIIYETAGGDRIIYVNGAVLRERQSGVTMAREPSIITDNDRLLFPTIETRPGNTVGVTGGNVIVTADSTGSNTLSYHDDGGPYTVNFTIETPRTEVWERYCARHPDLHVSAIDDGSEITCGYGEPGDEADSVYIQFRRISINFHM